MSMDLNDIRRTFNMRVPVAGLDNSDVSMTLKLWGLLYVFGNMVTGLFPIFSGILNVVLLGSFVPIAILVKVLKTGKNKGYLEYLNYRFFQVKTGKNGFFSYYNLKEDMFLNTTKNNIKRESNV